MTTALLNPFPSSSSTSVLSLRKGAYKFCSFSSFQTHKCHVKSFRVRALREKTDEVKTPSSSAEEITKKYGLEAGLWKIFSSKDEGKGDSDRKKSKGDEAKELLAKYGGAYLATSITLSLISFTLCYALISAGIDVQALLQKVGISADATGEKVGTFALAYAAHKAASPIRFPPTVALTPIVAGWIGKKVEKDK
ncbi:protein FAM210B, mitochondrial-like [Senna tora]|uniref:Protein FAM210B, mitochondrial-like n=1 Tax=Senna tora TaxID=362788 RepID=A0A834SR01_9FABA|nr:protein FAM210B, mitochondrial-like [Senna tora]